MFDRTDDYEEKIKPILKELNRMCVICGIPYFAAFCVKDMDGKTSYRNVLYSASNMSTIPDCTIREVVNFNQRQYVEEIMRQAWGYFLTPDEIPEEKLQAYSLVSADAAVSKWQPVAEKISEFSKKAGDDMEPEDILSAVTSGNLEEITGYLVGFSRSEYKKEALVLFREVNSLRSYS